jgi:hypothetical protein
MNLFFHPQITRVLGHGRALALSFLFVGSLAGETLFAQVQSRTSAQSAERTAGHASERTSERTSERSSSGLTAAQQKQRTLEGRDYIESTSYNEALRGSARRLQYRPEGDAFVCEDGNNRYTRALYGPHTPFRVETSDRPVFAIYNKPKSWHIDLRLYQGKQWVSLDSAEHCRASYQPGKRSYRLTDARWQWPVQVEVLALYDREAAIWKVAVGKRVSKASSTSWRLEGLLSPIRAARLNRSGDMGADPADSFEASLTAAPTTVAGEFTSTVYLFYEHDSLQILSPEEGARLFQTTEAERLRRTSDFRIDTPDPFLNTLGGALSAAADGIWSGEVWLHGANGWRMPLSGWRAAYIGDCLGWTDRARAHFDHYAASQVTDVAPVYNHPRQDTLMNLARAEKRWGTPMYSNGYICRNPERNNQMHHYDMNLCYIDELLWHLCWTGDTAYARKRWPTITRHLAWEKRNFDPDDDALYDAYCCIWASDALYYNSGAVTHSSAYNYRANRLAAEIARLLGEDATPFQTEADRIREALQRRLWMGDKGCWAEFQDLLGHQSLHTSPAVWTVYHAIDSEVSNPFQYYLATRYIDREIPHINVQGSGLADEGYQTITTTNWLPYSWSINNVAFAEVYHTALAYWQANRPEEAFRLFKSNLLDGMYLGNSPGNFGQLSFYDAARGECYRDFGDPIGIASRALVQGLFGIYPDLLHERLTLRPGLPADWDHASFHAPYLDFQYERTLNDTLTDMRPDTQRTEREVEHYRFTPRFARSATVTLVVPARRAHCKRITLNGTPIAPETATPGVGHAQLTLVCPTRETSYEVEIQWEGALLADSLAQPVEAAALPTVHSSATTASEEAFELVAQGEQRWWREKSPAALKERPSEAPACYGTELVLQEHPHYRPVELSHVWNARLTDLFRNQYLSPRSPYTTLQIPVQGIGEWCHPKETFEPDDSGFRSAVRNGLFTTPQGIPFRAAESGENIAYTSLWDNYPDSLQVALSGHASGIYLLLAGTTNHMQCHQENGVVRVSYQDGTESRLSLVNPENWAPIEQDYYLDGNAFRSQAPRPYRLLLATGEVSNDLEQSCALKGFNDRRIPGGAGILLYLPLEKNKSLKNFTIETKANEVVIGLIAATLID